MLVHTGQHYDESMSRLFFDELGLPAPGHQPRGRLRDRTPQQTAAIMARFEPVCSRHRPDLVLVVGDVNSTLACALVAAKLGMPVAHVEAGLRSFDRTMPEEINRLVTDALARSAVHDERTPMRTCAAKASPAEKIILWATS